MQNRAGSIDLPMTYYALYPFRHSSLIAQQQLYCHACRADDPDGLRVFRVICRIIVGFRLVLVIFIRNTSTLALNIAVSFDVKPATVDNFSA